MPFINVKTNVEVKKEKEEVIKSSLGNLISILPGKSQSWLMVSIEGNKNMYFKGDNLPCAMVEIDLYGKSSKDNYNRLTNEITKLLNKELQIDNNRIYVRFSEIENWGYSGNLF